MSTWNYRVMAIPHPKKGWDEVSLTINDVYYNDEGEPDSYGELMEAPTYRHGEVAGGDTIEEVRGDLDNMTKACDKPILCAGDKWPQEYKP